jgi:CRISPR-associated protein Cas2
MKDEVKCAGLAFVRGVSSLFSSSFILLPSSFQRGFLMFYLVCYDVVLDRRRNKVAHILEGYGLRVQKSVFECVLTPDQREMLNKKLAKFIDQNEDQVRFYPMSPRYRKKVTVMGMQPEREVDDVAFIV